MVYLGCCAIWNFPSKTHLKLRSSKISFAPKIRLSFGTCELSYVQTRLYCIPVKDEFRTDIPYCTTWWRHQMETFPRYWPFVRRIHRSPVNSPHKGQWRGALMFSLIYARINGWVNTREVGDLRRHQAHCDVIVMRPQVCSVLHCCGYITMHRVFPWPIHSYSSRLRQWHWHNRIKTENNRCKYSSKLFLISNTIIVKEASGLLLQYRYIYFFQMEYFSIRSLSWPHLTLILTRDWL